MAEWEVREEEWDRGVEWAHAAWARQEGWVLGAAWAEGA